MTVVISAKLQMNSMGRDCNIDARALFEQAPENFVEWPGNSTS
jgi:hypothetical protein